MPEFPVIAKGVYRHNKSGKKYQVLGVALQTETNDALVVYRPLDSNEFELFARPHAMFVELVDVGGQKMPRFEPIETPRTFIA